MSRIGTLTALPCGALVLLAFACVVPAACSSDSSPQQAAPVSDAGAEAADATTDPKPETSKPPQDAGVTIKCTLDQGGDPVGLCVQKTVLEAWHDAAFKPEAGVIESWDSTTFAPDVDGQGVALHDRNDDVAYAASLARYYDSAQYYGDTELTSQVAADLKDVTPWIDAEFAVLPDDYDGELYLNLRAAAGGLRVLNDLPDAEKLDAIAEAYGRAIFDKFYKVLPEPSADAGTPDADDAGSGPDAADAKASDSESGTVEVVTGNAIVGRPVGDQVQYDTASVASAAVVLADLAWRHPEEAGAVEWQRAAVRIWMHLWKFAREPSTGAMYRTMVTTSSGPDQLSGDAPQDAVLIDVQATTALSMLQTVERVNAHKAALSIVSTWPLVARAQELIASVNDAGLWDAELGGYYEGLIVSSSQTLTNKTTRGNGRMLEAVHRAAVEGSTPYATQMTTLRTLLMQRFPLNTSLLSALDGQAGYFMSVPRDYKMEGLEAGAPRSRSYFSKANGWGCEALADGWYGISH